MTQTNQTTLSEHLAHTQEVKTRAQVACAERELQGLPQRTEESHAFVRSQGPPPSNTRLIPSEIWQEIFDWYAALWCTFRTAAPTTSAWALGHVCQQWRDLALSTPQLWNHLPIVHITHRDLKDDRLKNNLEGYLLRSGALPLKLHFSFEISVDKIPERTCEILIPFFDHVNRWEHLTISGLTVMEAQAQFVPVRNHLSLLRSVTFNFVATTFDSFHSPYFDVFELAPRLTEINLLSPSPASRKSPLRFPWAQLTSYKESGIDMGTFPIVLDLSDGMRALEYRGRNFRYRFTEEIVQFSLRHLIIEVKEIERFWRHLKDVTLPVLETFSVRALRPKPRDRQPQISSLTDLIARSGCYLKRLVLDFCSGPIDGMEVKDLFLHMRDLETLELGDCHGSNFYEDVLPSLRFRQDQKTLLPHLRSLTLHNHEGFGSSDGFVISDVVRSRERAVVDGTSPGQLLAALEYVRVTTPRTYDRQSAMHQVLGEAEVLKTEAPFTTPSAADLPPAHRISALLEQGQKSLRHIEYRDQKPMTEFLSLFILACFTKYTHIREDALEKLEELGVLSIVKSYLLRHRWIPGCKEDILYVHPNRYEAAAVPDLWESIQTANLSRLGSLLGYQLAKERGDDLLDVDDLL